MRVLLVDDERLHLDNLRAACEKVLPEAKFFCFGDSNEALKAAKENPIDIAFLDINLPKMNGIELARKLKERDPDTKIIFVTAYENYALEAYSVRASGFILKPVSEKKIQHEIEALGDSLKSKKDIQVKCFGNFEIFHLGIPLQFKRSKSKEVLAYLIDREGRAVGVDELCFALWEEERASYFRNLVADIRQTLERIGCGDFFFKQGNGYRIDTSMMDCDAYDYKNGDPKAISMFRGEYMFQYPWAMFADD